MSCTAFGMALIADGRFVERWDVTDELHMMAAVDRWGAEPMLEDLRRLERLGWALKESQRRSRWLVHHGLAGDLAPPSRRPVRSCARLARPSQPRDVGLHVI